MSKLPAASSTDLVKVVKRFGYIEKRQRGSHLHLKEILTKGELQFLFIKGETFPKEP